MLQHEPTRWAEPLLAASAEVARLLVVVAAIATAVALLGAASAVIASAAAWTFDGLGAPDLARRALAMSP